MAAKKSTVVVENPANDIDGPTTEVDLAKLSYRGRQDLVTKANDLGELRAILGEAVAWEEIEPSFTVMKKDEFGEDQPFVIGAFRFNESKRFQRRNEAGVLVPVEFVSLLVAKYNPETEKLIPANERGDVWVILNDGSTGIRNQLNRYLEMTGDGIDPRSCPTIRAEKGLRVSRYDYEDDDGNVSTASTWYLA